MNRKTTRSVLIVSTFIMMVIAVSLLYWFVYGPGKISGTTNCFNIISYSVNPNGTLSYGGEYVNKSTVSARITSYGGAQCCGVTALNSSIGANAAKAYNLTSEFNSALANAENTCKPGVYN